MSNIWSYESKLIDSKAQFNYKQLSSTENFTHQNINHFNSTQFKRINFTKITENLI